MPEDASDPLPQPPDGFYVRLSATRDFEESYILPTVKGQLTRSVTVVIEPSTFIWLLEQPVYMSVSAYRTLDAVTSEWSKSVARSYTQYTRSTHAVHMQYTQCFTQITI